MKCKFCNTATNNISLDLGNAAPSNSLIDLNSYLKKEITYPLILYTCPNCFLVQIDRQLLGEEIFDENYVYFSSLSENWLKHCKEYSEKIISKLSLDQSSFVVEIASNDGYLLKNFLDNNINCLGIEPTRSTATNALLKGIPTIIDFFSKNFAENFVKNQSKADLIIANNVIAHVSTINDFIAGIKCLLKSEGTVTIEFPHLLQMVNNNQFDTIYHEHYFYHSIYTLNLIMTKHSLSIYDLDEIPTHGGSLRIYVTHLNNKLDNSSDKTNVNDVLTREINEKINNINNCRSLNINSNKIKLASLEFLINQKKNNKKIIGFGAAAKGNTFLNFLGIKNDIINFIVDETPFKIGKFTPQSKIPIVSIDKIESEKPDIIVILAWNHKDEIIKKLQYTKKWGAKFVTFIPNLKIY